ncbi:MAG: arylsulfatase [Fimbriimonadaceae bacterium]|nr:arylsulfatase [Fimbriimonadaceae bacterium]
MAAAERRPNIVFIIMDDLGYGDLACHGNPHTRTPHLDQLHHDGARLTRYCSGPLCTAARAATMTGRHPYRTRAIDTYVGRSVIDPSELTLPHLLRDAGYATGLFGKWHLGDTYPCRPHDQGFDEAYYHTGGGLRQPANVGRDSYFDPDLIHNGHLVHTTGYCTDLFAEAALRFIEAQRERSFFCYLATNAPHSPFEIADEWVAPYRAQGLPETWARVYGMVANIDHNVGRVLGCLDRLGLADNTVVVYTSDHGPCGSASVNRQVRWNAGLRGLKGQLYEGGVKVPCFVRWPGQIAPRDIDRLANPIDWLPTLTAVGCTRPPEDRAIDGLNLLPLLRGELPASAWLDRPIPMQWHRGDVPQRYRNAGVLGQRHKWYWPEGGQPEVYDLAADPAEQHNLAAAQPGLEQELRAVYDAWFDDVSNTRGNTPEENYAPVPIRLGTPHENPTALTRQDWRLYGTQDGWADHLPGYWPVQIETAGDYAVLLDLPPQAKPGTLTVRCGDLELQRPVPPGSTVAQFEHLTLPAGRQTFEAYLEVDGQRLGIRQARVRCWSQPLW